MEEEVRNRESYSPYEASKEEEPDQTWSSEDWYIDFKVLITEAWPFWSDYKKPYTKDRKPKICFSALQVSLCNGQIKITIPILRMGK